MNQTIRMALLAGASAVTITAFAAASANAEERTLSGNVDIYTGYSWLTGSEADGFNEDDDFPFFGGKGQIDVPFSDEFGIQLDIGGEGTVLQKDARDSYAGFTQGGVHLNYRQMDSYLVGAFAGGGVGYPEDTTSTGQSAPFYFVGIEGQLYLGDATLYAQGGYLDSAQDSHEALEDAWFGRFVGRYYFNSGQTLLEGEFGFASGEQDTNATPDDVDVYSWGVTVEHQVHTWGTDDGYMSVFASYQGLSFREDFGSGHDDVNDHAGIIGVKFAFNQPNQKARERNGVAVGLPSFGRWVAETVTVD